MDKIEEILRFYHQQDLKYGTPTSEATSFIKKLLKEKMPKKITTPEVRFNPERIFGYNQALSEVLKIIEEA